MNMVPASSIEKVAEEIFEVFDIAEFEERFSSHYVDEHYFVGRSDKFVLKVMLTDDDEYSDLPFWAHFERVSPIPELDIQFVENVVKEKLLPRGYKVARLERFGLKGEERIDY
jgi:hypothetical protein